MMVYSWLMVSARLALFAACWTCARGANAQGSRPIPVLTVCETLRNLNVYSGKTVVIVARSGWTFEGTFMNERCEPDGRIVIRGHRWLSMLEVYSTRDDVVQPMKFPVDENSLWTKLAQVSGYTETTDEHWVAVYGRIESPIRLKQKGRNARGYAGNGYGANGTVPARILGISSKTLIEGHGGGLKQPRPVVDLPEPPLLSIPFVVSTPPPVWLSPPVFQRPECCVPEPPGQHAAEGKVK